MAYVLHISLPDTEKELWKWLQEKISKKEISSSLVFRDALKELKRQSDLLSSENLAELHRKIDVWHKISDKQRDFLETRGLMKEFMEFGKKQMSKENLVSKDIEVFEIKK